MCKTFSGSDIRRRVYPRYLLRTPPLNGHRNEIKPHHEFRPESRVPIDSQYPGEINEIGDLEDIDEKRQSLYQHMLEPMLTALASEERVEPSADQVRLFLLLLLSSVNERMLFGDLKPARTLQIDDETFVTELTTALHAYLSMRHKDM